MSQSQPSFARFLELSQQAFQDQEQLTWLEDFCAAHPWAAAAHAVLARKLLESGRLRAEDAASSPVVQMALLLSADKNACHRYLFPAALPSVIDARYISQPSDSPAVTTVPDTGHGVTVDAPHGETNQHIPKTERHRNLIDRFLRENRQARSGLSDDSKVKEILSGKAEPEEAGFDNESIPISETLAQILLNQGKTDRAIAIYRKLSLAFPEKSSYFAKILQDISGQDNQEDQ